MIWHHIEQNSEAWDKLRIGKFTASSFGDLFSGKSTLTYKKAINEVAFGILTGDAPENFTNQWMERGHEIEPLAKSEYEMLTFNTVQPGGFFELNEFVGASPDGVIDEDGLLEIKCPAANTVIEYLLKKELPSIYFWQVHGQMYVSGRKWVDFMAFHHKLKPLIVRVKRDETVIKQLETELDVAIKNVKTILKLIQ